MRLEFRKWIVSHPTNVIAIAAVSGVIYMFSDGIVSPGAKDGLGMPSQVLALVGVCYFLFVFAVLVGAVISLVRRKWSLAICCFIAACITYASGYGSAALRGDRFIFPNWSHQEIADIYNQRRSELADASKGVRPISLDERCHPPNGCECWMLFDPAHSSGAEKEAGGWHHPTTSFPIPRNFAIVNVRRLDADAYSVLGCEIDWTSWKPV